MTTTLDSLLSEAMHLPPDQRLALAKHMLSSVEPEACLEVAEAWDAEIRQRIARYDAGELNAIPAADVFTEAERRTTGT